MQPNQKAIEEFEKKRKEKEEQERRLRASFHVRPEDVQKEIGLCPIEADDLRVICMHFEPPQRAESAGIEIISSITPPKVGQKGTGEPSSKNIPMAWVIKKGPKNVDTSFNPGDLIAYAGTVQEILLNKKKYIVLWGHLDVIGRIDRDKVQTYY